MINLEKKKKNRISASPPPPFKKTCPCTVLPPPFLIFQTPPPREVIKLYSPSFRKKGVCEGWGFPNYELPKKASEQSFYC